MSSTAAQPGRVALLSVQRGDATGHPEKVRLSADSFAALRAEVLDHVEQGDRPNAEVFYFDPEFDEWIVLSAEAYPDLPTTGLRLRVLAVAASTDPPHRPDAATGNLSLESVLIEDRFRTVALAILAAVACAFVLWYLQAILKVVVVAGLLSILLEPLVNLLSVPPEQPPGWARRLHTHSDGCSPWVRVLLLLVASIPMIRLPRALAILLTIALVCTVGTLLVILVYNTFHDFLHNVDNYLDGVEAQVATFKRWWKEEQGLATYVDVDQLLEALVSDAGDTSFLQGLLVQSLSYISRLVANTLLCMVMFIFLVMKPPQRRAAASASRETTSRTSAAPGLRGGAAGGGIISVPVSREASRTATPRLTRRAELGGAPRDDSSEAALLVGGRADKEPPPLAPQLSVPLSAQAQTRIYLRWKAAISLGKALACGLIYVSVGLPLWPVFAIVVFWLNWIPVMGGLIAIVLPMPLGLVDPNMSVTSLTLLLVLPTVVQIVVDNFIDQLVMARAMELHPLTIMVGLFCSNILWGVVGMMLSIPLMAAAKTTLAGTAHPYAQAVAAMLEGDLRKAALVGSNQPLPWPEDATPTNQTWSRLGRACRSAWCGGGGGGGGGGGRTASGPPADDEWDEDAGVSMLHGEVLSSAAAAAVDGGLGGRPRYERLAPPPEGGLVVELVGKPAELAPPNPKRVELAAVSEPAGT